MNDNLILFSLLNNFNPLFRTLFIFIIIDYITGVLNAIYNKKLNSRIGAKGIIKKIGYIIIVIIASLIDKLFINTGEIRNAIIYMFIANEGISIVENWSNMGIKIPQFLKDNFKKIEDENNNKN